MEKIKMKSDKKYLIIGEFGQERNIIYQKDLIKHLEISFKDLGLTKNDIILISSNDLENKTNLLLSSNKKENNSLNEIKEDYYLFSTKNKYEIYKQEFDNKLKQQIENNLYISAKDLFSDKLSFNFNNNSLLNKNITNNIQIQKDISHVQEIYSNFKSISINIDKNFNLCNSLINMNIININKSISILYKYLKTRIKNIQINFESLKVNLEEINKRVTSTEKRIKNFIIIKMGINNKEELELFKILINENQIEQMKEKINKKLNTLNEKMKNKSKIFEEKINDMNNNNINLEQKIKEIIDEKKLEEIKNDIKRVKEKFNALKNRYNKDKFNDEIKKIIEKYNNNIEKNSEDKFDINYRIDKLDDYKKEDELNIIIHNIKNIKSETENIVNKIKLFITESIIKKFFRFSSEIFLDLEPFESYNEKFNTYKNSLENISKSNFDLLFSIDEALRFKYYFNEYERRINYLKDLKRIIYKLKKSLIKENEIRQKFNEEIKNYFNGKINDNVFGMSNNIISYFEWDDIKGSFDIYGDKNYSNITLEEDELNHFNSNKKYDLSKEKLIYLDDIFSKNDFQQEMIYNLNNKILEYKSEINKLTNIIENKNKEFKQLKYNIEQINNLFNNKNKNIKYENRDIEIKKEESNGIKKENKIFNPLYDEMTDDNDINEEESFAIKDNNNDSNSSIEDDKNKNNINNENNIYLSLEQTFIIKKTFFNYFTNLLSIKNEEYNKLFSLYNSLRMSIEDK